MTFALLEKLMLPGRRVDLEDLLVVGRDARNDW